MLLKLSGWFRAHTSGPAREDIDAAKQQIFAAVREAQPGTSKQVNESITFRRGYSEWPYSPNRFSNFDPVRISLWAEKDDTILVRYDLGLEPLYLFFFVFVLITGYILFFYVNIEFIVIPVIIAPLVICIGVTLFNMWRVHNLLKTVVLSTVSKNLSQQEVRPSEIQK